MYINQSLSEHTLALFKTARPSQDGTEAPKASLTASSGTDQALRYALSNIAAAAQAGEPAAPVSDDAETGIPEEGGTYGGGSRILRSAPKYSPTPMPDRPHPMPFRQRTDTRTVCLWDCTPLMLWRKLSNRVWATMRPVKMLLQRRRNVWVT